MSQEPTRSDLNLERLRSFFQTWDPSEWARGENMSLFDPELIYEGDVLPDQVGETYNGHEGLARATRTWLDPIEEIAVELERIIGTGDCLVSVQRASGKMRHTGIQMARAYAHLWRFRDGQVAYLKTFGDTQEASTPRDCRSRRCRRRVRPCPSGTWYAYLLTLGLWEFWRRKKAYTLTNQRIIETKGILEKTETSLPLFFIQDATLRTWFFPRWGAVSVSTAGEVGAFTGTLWLRQAEARSLREGIVQEAERTRAVQGGLRPGGSSPLGAPRSAR